MKTLHDWASEEDKHSILTESDYEVHPFGYVCKKCNDGHYTSLRLLESHINQKH